MNIASYLQIRAASTPDITAVYFHDSKISYRELNRLSDRYAWGLKGIGIQKGDRLLLMIRPGIEFVALAFATLKLGAIAVLIDPGIGMNHLKKCIRDVKPDGFIGVPEAHLLKWIWPSSFKTVKYFFIVEEEGIFKKILTAFLKGSKLSSFKEREDSFSMAELGPNEPAAIIFTTGSTGPPKGVIYEHRMFAAQIEMLRSTFNIREGEIDMPTFPLFALFSVAMGTSCVIPDMDPTRPAQVDPRKIVEAIENHKVTYTFGSPALWNRVTLYCLEKNIQFPTVKRILIAGAPVPPALLERFQKILSPDAEVYTPYGATEALPVTCIGSREIAAETAALTREGKGICVGRPLSSLDVRIITIRDEPIPVWEKGLELAPNTIGEIVVKGPMVTRCYDQNEKETALAKIRDTDGSLWHRMGDVGYFDSLGRLWFCGRKAHRVVTPQKTYFSILCESIFNQHPAVFRSALVGVNQKPVIIIEPVDKKTVADPTEKERLRQELLTAAQHHPLTEEIRDILFHARFPVDIRHNSKIIREKLALWAKEKLFIKNRES